MGDRAGGLSATSLLGCFLCSLGQLVPSCLLCWFGLGYYIPRGTKALLVSGTSTWSVILLIGSFLGCIINTGFWCEMKGSEVKVE